MNVNRTNGDMCNNDDTEIPDEDAQETHPEDEGTMDETTGEETTVEETTGEGTNEEGTAGEEAIGESTEHEDTVQSGNLEITDEPAGTEDDAESAKTSDNNENSEEPPTIKEEPADPESPEEDLQPEGTPEPDETLKGKARAALQALAPIGHGIRTTLNALAPADRGIRAVWRKRPKLSFALYAIVFVLVTAAAVLFLQWSVCEEPTYAEDAQVDDTTRALNGIIGQLTKFVCQMWIEEKMTFLLNFLLLSLIYLVVVTLLNRFWVATALFGSVMVTFAVANHFKVQFRNEPIIPADLSFISGGNTGELMSFVPEEGQRLIADTVTGIIWFVAICVLLQFLDRRNGLIPCTWRPSRFLNVKNIALAVTRITAAAASFALLFSLVWNLGISNSWAQQWAQSLSDRPELWNSIMDAQNNGPAMAFLRLAHTSTMDKPEDYNEDAMNAVARRYRDAAAELNDTRTTNLTDSTVIMVLSETLSDPTRVPGVDFTIDPMPNIRALKNQTTSGLMLSPGYGGGTANIEYQALTGLTLANFDPSLIVPYQQLLPKMKQAYSFNQLWTERYGDEASVAFHPYYKSMYFRDSNYKKFGFSHLYTLDSDPAIDHQDRIDNSPQVSDAASYRNVLDALEQSDDHQFIQLVTMQNHMPYGDYYFDNEFRAADISDLSDGERWQIDNYTKGISITDQATAEFLDQLDALDEPVTVIFYGDHLPGIYETAYADENNAVTLHETDYFIWSNAASESHDVKLPAQTSDYTSSNYFVSSAAEHMNAKVSPYLAFLTMAHDEVPALSRIIMKTGGLGEGTTTCLDAQGNVVDMDSLASDASQLLEDYRLVQYDLTAGKGYLYQTDFFDLP